MNILIGIAFTILIGTVFMFYTSELIALLSILMVAALPILVIALIIDLIFLKGKFIRKTFRNEDNYYLKTMSRSIILNHYPKDKNIIEMYFWSSFYSYLRVNNKGRREVDEAFAELVISNYEAFKKTK